MAFDLDNGNKSRNGNSNDESWKAQGFLNLYLPSPTAKSGRRKLGAIPLRDKDDNEKSLRAWIETNPEAACKMILSKLVIEYNAADSAPGFELGDLPPVGEDPAPAKKTSAKKAA